MHEPLTKPKEATRIGFNSLDYAVCSQLVKLDGEKKAPNKTSTYYHLQINLVSEWRSLLLASLDAKWSIKDINCIKVPENLHPRREGGGTQSNKIAANTHNSSTDDKAVT